jgi:hypothetical protein
MTKQEAVNLIQRTEETLEELFHALHTQGMDEALEIPNNESEEMDIQEGTPLAKLIDIKERAEETARQIEFFLNSSGVILSD